MATYQENSVVKDVQKYFGFLFDKGYKVRDVRYFREAFGNWYVILESSKCLIRIECDRSEISVSFAPINVETKHEIGLGTLIYYISKGKDFVGYFEGNLAWGKNKQLERLSYLLSQYHDQIAFLFENDFERLQEDLALSQKKYGELLQQSYSQKFATEARVWKGFNLFSIFIKFIGISLLAFLGWGVGMVFVTETDIIAKLLYGIVALVILILLVVFTRRMLKDLGVV